MNPSPLRGELCERAKAVDRFVVAARLRGWCALILDGASYALLALRSVPALRRSGGSPAPVGPSPGPRGTRSARARALLSALIRHHARTRARARARCRRLAAHGVGEIAVLGGGWTAQWVCAVARARQVDVTHRSEDAGELVMGAGERAILVADREAPEMRWRALSAIGVAPERLHWLEVLPREVTAESEWVPERALDPEVDLSIVLPSRGRRESAASLLEQIHRSAARPGRVEILLLLDRDDPRSHDLDHPQLRVRRMIAPWARMSELANLGASAARGEAILLLRDDVRIRTPGWDLVFLRVLARFPDRIACVFPNAGHSRSRGAAFPLISKAVLREIGYAAPRRLRRDHIESHLLGIFRRLRRMGEDRLVYLESVVFEHPAEPRTNANSPWGPGWDDGAAYAALRSERARAARVMRDAIRRAARNASVPRTAGAPWLRSRQVVPRGMNSPTT